MILSQSQIRNVIIDNPNKDLVSRGVEYNKKLRLHMYGDGLEKGTEMIDGYEKRELRDLRAKYCRSNKDLFARLSRPIDKVFSARGGSIYYNLSKEQDKKARELSQNVRNGYSIRKWLEMFWKPHMLDDPFGIVFMEILPIQEAITAKRKGQSFVYPTYKSITSIYDYSPKGSNLDYVVFKLTKEDKSAAGLDDNDEIFRVVDDAFDYYVKKVDDSIQILPAFTIVNFFGEVPAILNSDINDPEVEGSVLSFFDPAIELAKDFLLKGSIKITHDFLHGFPKYWEYADSCTKCKGTGLYQGADCEDCRGTGKNLMRKVSDAKLLEYPATKEDPVVTPNVAGYVSPDKTFYEIATADIQLLEDLMTVTLWGTHSKIQNQGMQTDANGDAKTATEVMDEIKPQSDRLTTLSEMAEKRHKFILDANIRLQVSPGYGGASVNYGRRYMLEGPDAIWEKYSDARLKGVAISALDDLLTEYYETKFSSDPVKLAIQLKLMKVEPFVHYKIGEVMGFRPDPADYKAKLYFGEWLSVQSEALILSTDVALLRESLNTYSASKKIIEDEPKPIAA